MRARATATSRRTSGRFSSTSSRPFRERTQAFLDDPETLDAILARGAERARSIASETLAAVYERVGFLPAKR
jgi:hypothetical protein